jgi:DNA-binding SARP family transcriptional activator
MKEAVQLRLLGGFQLLSDGVALPMPRNCQRLLVFVALLDQPRRREYIAWTLWPDGDESRALGSLRTTLWRMPRPDRRALIDDYEHCVRLSTHVETDWRCSLRRAEQVIAGDDGADHALLDHLSYDLLPDWYEDWLLLPREQYRQLRLQALEIMATRRLAAGLHSDALNAGLRAVAAEPLRESAHRCVIAAHLAQGNRCEAVRQYQLYLELLGAASYEARPSQHLIALMSAGEDLTLQRLS